MARTTRSSASPPEPASAERLFHVTVLSNFARAYDRYARRYTKRALPQSTFPDRFFLLQETELPIGIRKASGLLEKLALAGDRLLVLETRVQPDRLKANTRSGLGRYVDEPHVHVEAVHLLDGESLAPYALEDACADSLAVLHPTLKPFEALRPRAVSLLPIARGCQAACGFCFSEASISSDQAQGQFPLSAAVRALEEGLARGAERAVITGGGEPGLVRFPALLELVRACASRFPRKVVLITNGVFLSQLDEAPRREALRALDQAGLTVLSISRHHADELRNHGLMQLRTGTQKLLASIRELALPTLRPRLIAVLQEGGVDSSATALA